MERERTGVALSLSRDSCTTLCRVQRLAGEATSPSDGWSLSPPPAPGYSPSACWARVGRVGYPASLRQGIPGGPLGAPGGREAQGSAVRNVAGLGYRWELA